MQYQTMVLNNNSNINDANADYAKLDAIHLQAVKNENENDESYLPLLELAKKRNLKLLCANPDIWVQRGKDLIPCAGAISKKYKSIGGETINIGKPFAPIFDEAIKKIKDSSKPDNKIGFAEQDSPTQARRQGGGRNTYTNEINLGQDQEIR